MTAKSLKLCLLRVCVTSIITYAESWKLMEKGVKANSSRLFWICYTSINRKKKDHSWI